MTHVSRFGRAFSTTCIVWLATALGVNAQAPNITAQPVPQTVQVGDGATFSVTATGAAPLYYQWKLGTTNLPGATSNPLVIPAASYAQAGNYSVTVSNSVGPTTSDKALLAVLSREAWGWGRNDFGQATVPTDLSNVVAVSAGSVHSLALRRDGSLAAWGYPGYGVTNIPAGLSNVVAIACGEHHNLVLKADGKMAAWGTSFYSEATAPNWTNVVAIAAGYYHNLALTGDGYLHAWGDGFDYATAVPTGPNFVAIACAGGNSMALHADGNVIAWGQNYGLPWNTPTGLTNAVAFSAGLSQLLALDDNGQLSVFGGTVPEWLDDVVAVSGGLSHSLALQADGTLAAWGDNSFGQTNVPPYAFPVGSFGAGSYARHSLAAPAAGAPFLLSRLANQVWTYPPPASSFFIIQATGARTLRYQWRRNGVNLPGETNALLRLVDLAAAQGSYSVVVSNLSGSVTSSPATLTVVGTPLQTALDNHLPWSTGGTAGANTWWYLQSTQAVDGVDAARSGNVTHSQESWLETSVEGPGFLAFWWMVSSEQDYDFLEFYLDGVLQAGRISGNVPWQQRIVQIANGPHTLRWRYMKGLADSAGWDAGFLDYVSFSETLPGEAKLPNGSFQLTFTSGAGQPYTIVGSTNVALPLASWPVLGNPTEIIPGQYVFTDPLATNHVRRFYRVRSP